MAFKYVVFSCLLAFARASVAPLAAAPVAARLEEFDSFPQYRFGYDVADSLTGDYKTQNEQRDGDLVQGQYSLVESDGTRRVVDYTADSVNGFNAVVRKEPLVAAAPAVVAEPAVFPARYAAAPAPVFARYAAAPVVAAAPVAKYAAAYTAPVAAAYSAPVAAAAYTAAYTAPVATGYSAAYTAPFARVAAAPVASYAPYSPFARFTAAPFRPYAPAAPVVAV